LGYEDAVELALLRDRERMDAVHGLAEYAPDELREKLWSLFPDIEYHGNYLWCAAAMELTAPLTTDETARLKDWWSGQLSDGWGEGFEQREINVGREELYIVPWSSDDGFFIDTEREFRRRLRLEPSERAALSAPQTPKERLTAKLGAELDEYHTDLLTKTKEQIIGLAFQTAAVSDAFFVLNEGLNLSDAQIAALLEADSPLRDVAEALRESVNEHVGELIEEDILEIAHIKVKAESRDLLVQRREDGTTSVLDTLRRARENPPEAKPKINRQGHNKSDHDL
jgi:hypothetical protein